jgi:hypothetical protein
MLQAVQYQPAKLANALASYGAQSVAIPAFSWDNGRNWKGFPLSNPLARPAANLVVVNPSPQQLASASTIVPVPSNGPAVFAAAQAEAWPVFRRRPRRQRERH